MWPATRFTQADCAAYVNLPLVAHGQQGGARRGPAGRRRHRLEGLRQADRRAAQRAARGGRPQGRHRAHGGGSQEGLKQRRAGWASGRLRLHRGRSWRQPRADFLAVAVELLHAGEAALEQQAQVVQDALDDLGLPDGVELDLLVQPALQPGRVGQAALDGVAREQPCVDVQVGRVQRLRGAPRAGHQHADLGKGGARLVAEALHRALHVAQVGAAMARLVLGQGFVDVADDRLAVPFGGTAVPVVEPDLAAEVQHQRFQRRRRVELEAHRVQLFLGGHQVRAEAAQVFHQHQRVLLLLEEPHAHEGGEVAVAAVVAQEHLGGRQRRPLGDGVHLDGLRLLVAQAARRSKRSQGMSVSMLQRTASSCLKSSG